MPTIAAPSRPQSGGSCQDAQAPHVAVMHRCGGLGAAGVLLLASVAYAERPDIDRDREEERPPPAQADEISRESSQLRPAVPRQVPFVVIANGAWQSASSATHAPFGAAALIVVSRRLHLGAEFVAATEPIEDRALHHEGWIRPALRIEVHGLPNAAMDPWLGFSGGPMVKYLNWYEGAKRHRQVSADIRAEAGLDFRFGSGALRWILGPSGYLGTQQERGLVARAGIGFF